MVFEKYNLTDYDSNIQSVIKIDKSERVLLIEVRGDYRKGSNGNIDNDIIFSTAVSYYFIIEPSVIIINLTSLNYDQGNSLIKVLNLMKFIGRDNFEKNIPVLFVVSEKNRVPISSLLGFNGNKLPGNYFETLDDAIHAVSDLLEPI